MSPSIHERAADLRREIARHDRLYYVEAQPEIGDADYDRLYRELEALEQAHPEIRTPDSPTQRVGGAPLTAFASVRHDPPMMSLDKTHAYADLLDFDRFLKRQLGLNRIAYVVEPKIDGVAFSLRYEHGLLVRAATRGNGEVGDDVTQNVRTIRTLPLRLATAAPLVEVRGEVFMTKAGFLRLTTRQEADGEAPFMNPRNAAAGSLKLLDPREVAARPLDAVLYAAGALSGIAFATHDALLAQLAAWGFRTPQHCCCPDIDAVIKAIRALEKQRHDFPFEMDGAVVKANDRALYEALGATAKSPRWARAFKYEPERAETIIRQITVQVGRTGVLTPVAELEPVLLAGSTIARATLHNADEIARKDIRVGDHVWIVKAGDVIPAIESVILEKRAAQQQPFVMPATCPTCGGAAERRPDEVALRCVNPACPAQLEARLEHFAARAALDLRGLGGAVAEALVAQAWIHDPLDLFDLTPERLAILNLGDSQKRRLLGPKNAAKMLQALEAARALPLDRWLVAIGIPRIGVTAAAQVASCHARLSDIPGSTLLQGVVAAGTPPADAPAQPLAATAPAASPPCPVKYEAAKAVLAFFSSPYGAAFLIRLRELGIEPAAVAAPATPAAGPLSGQTFVITGVLSIPRHAMAERIQQAGGKLTEAVTKSVTALVTGADPGETKVRKAQELGVRQLSEPDLLALLESAPPPAAPPAARQPELF